MTEIDPATHEELASALECCGVPRSAFEISYEDFLQSEAIRILSSTLTDTQIECVRAIERASPYPVVFFLSEAVARRDRQLSERGHRDECREWFRERGQLDRLPVFDPTNETKIQFANRLEEFCGLKAGSVFELNEQLDVITPKLEWIDKPLRKGWLWRKLYGARHNDQFECLMKAMSATNAAEHGLSFGFVGNEAYATEQPKH